MIQPRIRHYRRIRILQQMELRVHVLFGVHTVSYCATWWPFSPPCTRNDTREKWALEDRGHVIERTKGRDNLSFPKKMTTDVFNGALGNTVGRCDPEASLRTLRDPSLRDIFLVYSC